MVDTLGLLLAVAVHPANVQDRDGAKQVLNNMVGLYPRLKLIWADGAYGGQAGAVGQGNGWLESGAGCAGPRSNMFSKYCLGAG